MGEGGRWSHARTAGACAEVRDGGEGCVNGSACRQEPCCREAGLHAGGRGRGRRRGQEGRRAGGPRRHHPLLSPSLVLLVPDPPRPASWTAHARRRLPGAARTWRTGPRAGRARERRRGARARVLRAAPCMPERAFQSAPAPRAGGERAGSVGGAPRASRERKVRALPPRHKAPAVAPRPAPHPLARPPPPWRRPSPRKSRRGAIKRRSTPPSRTRALPSFILWPSWLRASASLRTRTIFLLSVRGGEMGDAQNMPDLAATAGSALRAHPQRSASRVLSARIGRGLGDRAAPRAGSRTTRVASRALSICLHAAPGGRGQRTAGPPSPPRIACAVCHASRLRAGAAGARAARRAVRPGAPRNLWPAATAHGRPNLPPCRPRQARHRHGVLQQSRTATQR